MSRKDLKEIIGQFRTDLHILSEILEREDISTSGPGNIVTASYNLLRVEGGKTLISFVGSDIDIKIDSSHHIMPGSAIIEDRLLVDIIFRQNITGQKNVKEAFERVIENQISFRLRGKKGKRELVSAWHFDRHAYPPANNSPCHPTYHFQFGGRGLKDVADKIDGIIVLDTPRYFAPPMDPILAVDFLLSHFNGSMWHSLQNDVRYIGIVRRAQERLWKPYFDQISNDLSPVATGLPARQLRLLPNVL